MKALFDTSVLVAGLIDRHPFYDRAFPWLSRVSAGNIELWISAHTLAETFSAITTFPIRPRISPATVRVLIRESIVPRAQVVTLDADDYLQVVERQASRALPGGSIYDALHVRAAEKAEVDLLVTFNPSDFHRVWPEGGERIRVP